MSSNLYKNGRYLANIDYVFGADIVEYDMTKANISVLRDLGHINEASYQKFLAMPKLQREITIGLMRQRDPSLTSAIKAGIIEARRAFFELNDVEDFNVLAIKDDSITLINKPVITQQVSEHVFFKVDGVYNNYFCVSKKEIYYGFNRMTSEENIRVKGIGEDSLALHKNYMLDFISAIMQSILVESPASSIDMINHFYNAYVNKECDIGYYRRFDAGSRYDIVNISDFCGFQSEFASQENIDMIDIRYNEFILRQIQRIISSFYFSNTRY